MKKVALLATVLALAIGASAQASRYVYPDARHSSPNAVGNTSNQPTHAVNEAAKTAVGGGQQAPPVQKMQPNVIDKDNQLPWAWRLRCFALPGCKEP
ncbi:MAG: hypothetical protein ACLPND_20100 [Candidatus Korobacteraceae bacterium]|jgi:hypothetical protein